MNTSEPKPTPEPTDKVEPKAVEPKEKLEPQATPGPPARYRPKLSQHQKKRSRLDQVAEEPATAPAASSPAITLPPAASPETSAGEIPLIRRNRLKRSGQMHEDLTKPLPGGDPSEPEPQY
ncbi:MAG: hypothetical protein ACR2NX_15645 [Chthoniobacterales bacterium]